MSIDAEVKKRMRQEVGVKAGIAFEYIASEVEDSLKALDSQLEIALGKEEIDKDKILTLCSRRVEIRAFLNRIESRIKQSRKE